MLGTISSSLELRPTIQVHTSKEFFDTATFYGLVPDGAPPHNQSMHNKYLHPFEKKNLKLLKVIGELLTTCGLNMTQLGWNIGRPLNRLVESLYYTF